MHKVKMFVLPGGFMPVRETKGAVGYDVRARAIVSATDKDPDNSVLRKTLFDFQSFKADPSVSENCVVKKGEQYVYRLFPGKSALVGIGVVVQMAFPMYLMVLPRSGLATKDGIVVQNAPGTVDPDYRGEAGVLLYNSSSKPYDIEKDMRIAQVVFQMAIIPEIESVKLYTDLSETARGSGGFGSTGMG